MEGAPKDPMCARIAWTFKRRWNVRVGHRRGIAPPRTHSCTRTSSSSGVSNVQTSGDRSVLPAHSVCEWPGEFPSESRLHTTQDTAPGPGHLGAAASASGRAGAWPGDDGEPMRAEARPRLPVEVPVAK